jgi:outer membrane protein TolC
MGLAAMSKAVTPEDVIRQIEASHPKLLAARARIEAAAGRERETRGAFDPTLSVNSRQYLYNSSSARGKAYATEMTETVVEVLTPGGMRLFAGSRLNLGDVKSPNSSTGTLGEYFIGLRVPLMRDNGLNVPSVARRQAELQREVALQDYELERLQTLMGGVQAYWQWAASVRKAEIAKRVFDLAVDRAAQIEKRVLAKDLARIELVEAQTEVRRREADWIRAVRNLQSAVFNLNLYLWDGQSMAERLMLPAAEWSTPTKVTPTEEQSSEERAVRERPELETLAFALEATKLTLDHARADRRPSLDFVLSPGADFGNDAVGPTMYAALLYSIPLRQNAVDGRIGQAQESIKRIEFDRNFEQARIRTQVRDAVNAVNAAFDRYHAALAEVELARGLERGERIRYESGDGTLFLLIQRERTTADAEARLVDVMAEYESARVALRAAEAGF